MAITIASDWKFDACILLIILVNCIVLVIDNPLDTDQGKADVLEVFEYVFTVIFSVELVIKTLALGFMFNGPTSYIRSGWNMIDFAIVLAAWIGIAVGLDGNTSSLRGARVLRGLRSLRGFRVLNPTNTENLSGLKEMMRAMVHAFTNFMPVLCLLAVSFLLFGIAGLQLFSGALRQQCLFTADDSRVFDTTVVCGTDSDCGEGQYCGDSGENPNAGATGFDNMLQSWLTVFVVVSTEGWSQIMWWSMKATSSWAALYFIFILGVVSFFIVSLTVGVMWKSYSEALPKWEREIMFDPAARDNAIPPRIRLMAGPPRRGNEAGGRRSSIGGGGANTAVQQARRMSVTLALAAAGSGADPVHARRASYDASLRRASLDATAPSGDLPVLRVVGGPRRNSVGPSDALVDNLRDYKEPTSLHYFVRGRFFRVLSLVLVLANTALMCSQHADQPDGWTDALRYSKIAFTAIFAVEVLISIAGFGPKVYFKDKALTFDALVVAAGFVELLAVELGDGRPVGIIIFRAVSLLRITEMLPSVLRPVTRMKETLSDSIVPGFYLCVLFFLFLFIFAIMGVELFAGKMQALSPSPNSTFGVVGPNVLSRTNFDTFGNALAAVFQIMLGEGLDVVMYDAMAGTNSAAAVYFIACFCLGNFFIVNMFFILVFARYFPERDDAQDEAPYFQLKLEGTSLFFLGPENRFRALCHWTVSSKPFEALVYFCILITTFSLCFYKPDLDPESFVFMSIRNTNYLSTTLFALEAALKIISNGFFFTKDGYLKDGWNRLDFLIVLEALYDWSTGSSSNVNGGTLKSLRAIRVLRLLQLLTKIRTLQVVLKVAFKAFYQLLYIAIFYVLAFVTFGVVGMNVLGGRTQWCADLVTEFPLPLTETECATSDQAVFWTNPGILSFDHIGSATLTLWEVSTLELWPDAMSRARDTSGVGDAPLRDNNSGMVAFFVIFVIIAKLLLFAMVTSVVASTFKDVLQQETWRNSAGEGAAPLRSWHDRLRWLWDPKTSPPDQPLFGEPPNDWQLLRMWSYNTSRHYLVDVLVQGIVLMNVGVMALQYHDQNSDYSDALLVVRAVFFALFTAEMIIKGLGFGWQFFRNKWCVLDACIWVMAFVQFFFGYTGGFDPQLLRVVRLLRFFYLLDGNQGKNTKNLLSTMGSSFPAISVIFLLLTLALTVFSIAGVLLFGNTPYRNYVTEDSNFNSFASAMLLLLRVLTGENWNGIMHELMPRKQVQCDPDAAVNTPPRPLDGGTINCGTHAAVPYFLLFLFVTQYLLLNLIVAVVLHYFAVTASLDEDELDDIGDIELARRFSMMAKRASIDNGSQHNMKLGSTGGSFMDPTVTGSMDGSLMLPIQTGKPTTQARALAKQLNRSNAERRYSLSNADAESLLTPATAMGSPSDTESLGSPSHDHSPTGDAQLAAAAALPALPPLPTPPVSGPPLRPVDRRGHLRSAGSSLGSLAGVEAPPRPGTAPSTEEPGMSPDLKRPSITELAARANAARAASQQATSPQSTTMV